MKFILKNGTEKKLKEQLYLGLFFAFIIWVLMAFLFIGDNNSRTLIIYFIGSLIIIPILYKKHIKPYFDNLRLNTNNAFLEIEDNKVFYNHFDNLKTFDNELIEFQISDIVNIKKAFRKDDSVNKITLTVNNKKNNKKEKIVIEDFENMQELVRVLTRKIIQHQNSTPPNSID